ncbi:hypothetical protein [Gracilibacillus thailandensis]|uniref:5,10-methylene-tetrahydrofolate dehydrogenase n=1 Tax=Gracilibacillus thailandensis TaxID=563735 RepID=A0A6N7R4Q8_9BACI|nr:hypothetical protein [Gracilibacillus thailandensis]MRI68130.1 hypothetical protein [Gracilibacillus thailandensis]
MLTSSNKKIKIITAPGFADDVIDEMKSDLPSLLEYYVDETVNWEFEHETDPLTGSTENAREILESILENAQEYDNVFLICLTDLPLFHNSNVVLAEAYEKKNIALLSLPALGSTPMVKRIRASIIQLVNEMYRGVTDEDQQKLTDKIEEAAKDGLRIVNGYILVSKKGLERFSPVRRETPLNGEKNIDVRFTIPSRYLGGLRILPGMVRANRPCRMFPSFIKVMVVAFTTGTYALIFPTSWMLASAYDTWRMIILSVVSIIAMVTWIIVAHKLWESPRIETNNLKRMLYNITTVCTLVISVTLFYLNLYLLFLIAVFLFIPIGMLESQVSSHVNYSNYFYIAWIITSFATIIGALGSALESEETILSATYGYRQKQRYEQLKRKEKETTNFEIRS